MRLYVAEKPSLGRAIAGAISGDHKRHANYIELTNGDCVSWCVGHLLEQAAPDDYDDSFKQWRRESLPIVPEKWQLKSKSQTRQQLATLKKLVKKAEVLVHAGDPDREGQLLVDQLFDYLKITPKQKGSVLRCLISDLNTPAVKKALSSMQPNHDFRALSISGLARARADWLYGMNLTRAFTLSGQKNGYRGVLSVGRVQTPLLALVVRRDQEIADFQSHSFYEVYAQIAYPEQDDMAIYAKWQPSEACEPYQDDQGRVISRSLAENVIRRIQHQDATVVDMSAVDKKQIAPLPYNLSSLQIDAAKRYSLPAKKVLDICQQLYEKHKLITYPRSDCRYLPEGHFSQANQVAKAIAFNSEELKKYTKQVDTSIKSRAWNDKKTGAHHAIIPTLKTQTSGLSAQELKVYTLIARQYLAQFFPPCLIREQKITFDIAGGCFIAKASQTQSLGWKVMFQSSLNSTSAVKAPEPATSEANSVKLTNSVLPNIEKGQALRCLQGLLDEKQTTPPAHFTDATLLSAMTGISRFVSDPELRKTLKETDGLGTEATRAGIIELLFKRQFIVREGKLIRPTQAGSALINGLPKRVTLPDLTAHWEQQLDFIKHGALTYKAFMEPLIEQVGNLVVESDTASFRLPSASDTRKDTKRYKTASSKSKRPKQAKLKDAKYKATKHNQATNNRKAKMAAT